MASAARRDKGILYIRTFRVLTATVLLGFASCGGDSNSSTADSWDDSTNWSEAQLEAAYQAAIADASIAEQAERSPELTAIVPENSNLVWKGEDNYRQVLVTTWTSWDGYWDFLGQPMTTTRETWVTAVPEVQVLCLGHGLSEDRLILRLEQLLGLPPHNGKLWFVEIWVRPADLFRPTPDPEVTDQTAELDFEPNVSAEYVDWFNTLRDSSYGADGYPWTRLGYTYDWGNPQTEVGPSEFVIHPGATVEVNNVQPTAEYCVQ